MSLMQEKGLVGLGIGRKSPRRAVHLLGMLVTVAMLGNAHAKDNPLHFNEAPVLWEGQSVTYGEYTITVQYSYYYSDVVSITKTNALEEEPPPAGE